MEPKPKNSLQNTSQRTPDQRARLWTIPAALALVGMGLQACANNSPNNNRRLEQPVPEPLAEPTRMPVFRELSQVTTVDRLFYQAATAQPQEIPEYFFSPTAEFSQADFELARKSVLRLELYFPGKDVPIQLSAVVTSVNNSKLQIMTARHAFLRYDQGIEGLAQVRKPKELDISRPDVSDASVRLSSIESIKYGSFEDGFDIALITVDMPHDPLPFNLEPTPYLADYKGNAGQPVMILGYPEVYYLNNSNQAALAATQGTISNQTDILMTSTQGEKKNETVYTRILCGNAPANEGMSGGGMFTKQNGVLYCIGINSLIYHQTNPVYACSAFIPERELLTDM